MFSKVFKYDFKFFFRIWWIAALTIFILAIGSGFMIRGLDNQLLEESTAYIILVTLALFAVVITASLLPVSVMVLAAVRYYQNLFSDQGYLTFTLPVKRSHHLNSKLLAYLLFQLLTVSVLLISAYTALYIGFYQTEMLYSLNESYQEFIQDFGYFFSDFGQTNFIAESILYILMILSSVVMGINLLYMSITVGATIAKKHKVLAAVGVFYGLNFCISFVNQLVSSLTMTHSLITSDLEASYNSITLGYTIFSVVFYIGLSILFYTLNLHFINKKLNLA